MSRLSRGVFILFVVLRYGLDELVLSSFRHPWLRLFTRILTLGRNLHAPRGERLREALERLGPIFVKFGQVLSTRRDLMPPDIAEELAKLQDRVPPFSSEVAVATIERAFRQPVDQLFETFEREPVASASIAQVHFATLRDKSGQRRDVAVKVLRPGMLPVIEKDLALMRMMAGWVEKLSDDGKRLKPREVVAEFDKYLHDELDLVREAANAAQLRRNMEGLGLVLIPEMLWDFCHPEVIVMERMKGVPISQVDVLRAAGVDISKLARDGVTLFFTQVFRDGFFHADMHPGNIQVSLDPATFGRYISLDFGIVGTLTEFDKEYLAQNFTAFFQARLQARGRVAHRVRLGAATDPGGRTRSRHPRGVRTVFRSAAQGDFAGHGADAAVPDLAPLPCRDPAATGAAAKDPAQHRRPGPPARSRSGFVEHGQAFPGAVDARSGRTPALVARTQGAGTAVRQAAASIAPPVA